MTSSRVLSLYRNTLKICIGMGYNYGRWNGRYLCDYNNLSMQSINEMIRRGVFADVVWNNVRYEYKKGVGDTSSRSHTLFRNGELAYIQLRIFMPIYFRKRHSYILKSFR